MVMMIMYLLLVLDVPISYIHYAAYTKSNTSGWDGFTEYSVTGKIFQLQFQK